LEGNSVFGQLWRKWFSPLLSFAARLPKKRRSFTNPKKSFPRVTRLYLEQLETRLTPSSVSPLVVVAKDNVASQGFWANNNGQALIQSAQWGDVGSWLATNWSSLFGNLAGATNAQVASYFIKLKGAHGLTDGTVADAMTLALGIYATTTGEGWGATSQSDGFEQGFGGACAGSLYYNVGNNGVSCGVANNTYMTVAGVLNYFNSETTVVTGGSNTTLCTWCSCGGNTTLLNGANVVIDGIIQKGDIV
jgi:hypothetical protein